MSPCILFVLIWLTPLLLFVSSFFSLLQTTHYQVCPQYFKAATTAHCLYGVLYTCISIDMQQDWFVCKCSTVYRMYTCRQTRLVCFQSVYMPIHDNFPCLTYHLQCTLYCGVSTPTLIHKTQCNSSLSTYIHTYVYIYAYHVYTQCNTMYINILYHKYTHIYTWYTCSF